MFHRTGGLSTARAEHARRSGRWFDPAVVAAFERVCVDAFLDIRLADAESYRPPIDSVLDEAEDDLLDDIAPR